MCRTFWSLVAALLAAMILVGCQSNTYEVELKPSGATMHRKLTAWRSSGSGPDEKVVEFPQEELNQITAGYKGQSAASENNKHVFAGDFRGRMPVDVGGAGTYTHWETRFGSSSAYIERFRGNDDLAADLAERHRKTDRIVDLLVGWLQTEVGKEQGFDPLKKFVDEDLRHDLWNLNLYLWSAGDTEDTPNGANASEAINGDDAMSDALVRMGLYLVERNYFQPEDLPALYEATGREDAGLAALASWIEKPLRVKLGIAPDAPLPPALNILTDQERLVSSLDKYLRGTEEYRKLRSQWEAERAAEPVDGVPVEATPPTGTDALEELTLAAFLPNIDLDNAPDALHVKLAAPAEPYLTNGKWDHAQQRVVWKRSIAATNTKAVVKADVLYAFWSSPNAEFQKQHFGSVVLRDDSLASYCLWRKGLPAARANEWDQFVDSLDGKLPAKQLIAKLADFRFAGEPVKGRTAAFEALNSLVIGLGGEPLQVPMPEMPNNVPPAIDTNAPLPPAPAPAPAPAPPIPPAPTVDPEA
jgi:hypothetical protein